MMNDREDNPGQFVENIRRSGLSIYDPIPIGDPNLWIPTPELEGLLNAGLKGLNVNYPLRTRSKIIKTAICQVLGYPVPKVFKKTNPRFPGQMFDTYGQQKRNLQIWNEDVAPARRYVLINISEEAIVVGVRIVTGDTVALLDITPNDTERLGPFVTTTPTLPPSANPTDYPEARHLLAIALICEKLAPLIGQSFEAVDNLSERLRGAGLHRRACYALGYKDYRDNGQFPDIRHQLLEVKLQTSPTIDLGLVRPDSTEVLDVPMIEGHQIRHCDVRYAIFYGHMIETNVRLTHLLVTTGWTFFTRFPQFQGKVLNSKIQIPLPSDFFNI
jgi:hypothetical protein